MQAGAGVEAGVAAAAAVEALGEAAEGRPAPGANPWLSLPQRRGRRRREGQAVFHERHGIP